MLCGFGFRDVSLITVENQLKNEFANEMETRMI